MKYNAPKSTESLSVFPATIRKAKHITSCQIAAGSQQSTLFKIASVLSLSANVVPLNRLPLTRFSLELGYHG